MQPFTAQVVKIIQSIPSKKVMTYGQIAKLAGSPRGARQVVRILHSMSSKYSLPWHRVVNVKGYIAMTDEEGKYSQRFLLESEGVVCSEDGKVNLSEYQYFPDVEDDFDI